MKNYLCGLILIFATPFLLQSQGDVGDPLYLITMVQLEDGAADAYIDLMQTYMENVRARDGHNFPDFTYATDDNVIYHSEQISSMADIDVLNASSDKDREFMGDKWPDLMNQWLSIADNTYDFVIEANLDLSYSATGEHALSTEEALYQRWIFFDFDMEDYGTVMELAAQMKQMQTEKGATMSNNVYFNVFGAPAGQIIIHQFAKDAADMERRQELNRELMAGDEVEAWDEKVQQILGDPSAVRTGRLLPAYSEAIQASKEK
ncbi:MAG: hypothetical protein AAF433_12505 [Bacteroidota bacterium]